MARHVRQVTCAACHSLDAGCCVLDIGSRWVHPLCCSYNPDPATFPSYFMASSSSSSCLSTFKSMTKLTNSRWTVMKQWHGVTNEREEAILLGWCPRMRLQSGRWCSEVVAHMVGPH
ncbi:hypothetical protein B296_00039781 [Ensete ventricosum]|uniref:Uncharacterized protein n=1 Tax=Ensete ventricosum TaxID=4639 RepID=A0A426YC64_ENSVE|nr:hypothetical protein B296_00039781 [Ensete ventricosum]